MPPRVLFADSFYLVALLNPRDACHASALAYGATLGSTRHVTTDLVLTEVLNHFSRSGPYWRARSAVQVRSLRGDPDVDVLSTSVADFDAALALYESRLDKSYSLTDCRSMLALRALGVSEVLTNDHHFTQEGFTILFPTP
jgi:predicted nucleic acid-binding protein